MQTIESAPVASNLAEDIDTHLRALLDGAPSSDYNVRQMQLIVEQFVTTHPEETLDQAKLDRLGMEWADAASSKGFSRIARDPAFANHPRFQGNVANITLEDVNKCLETGEMPEV